MGTHYEVEELEFTDLGEINFMQGDKIGVANLRDLVMPSGRIADNVAARASGSSAEANDRPVRVDWHREEHIHNLLFVDDDPRALRLCVKSFAEGGYVTFTATSAAEGLEIIDRQPIDLVVSDMRMPGMNGADFLAEVEKHNSAIVKVLISGKFDFTDTVEAVNKGHIYGYVAKPFDPKDLKLMVYKGLLRKNQVEREQKRSAESRRNAQTRAKEIGQLLQSVQRELDSAWTTGIDALMEFSTALPERRARINRMATLARSVAQAMGGDDDFCAQLNVAVCLKDLARCAAESPKSSNPPSPETTRRERALLPVRSAVSIAKFPPYADAARMIRHHRERYDGKGYPDRLVGDDIPLGARILRVVEDYEELRHSAGLDHHHAINSLVRKTERYDLRLLEVLRDCGAAV